MVETFFTEKRIIKKLIIAIIFVFLFNFTFSYLGNNVVFAANEEDGEVMDEEEIMEEEGGGKLLIPIHALLLFLSDSVLEIMQNSFISSEPVTITGTAESESSVNGWAIAGIAIGIVVCTVACIVTYGAAAPVISAAAGATSFTAGVTAVTTAVATYGGTLVGGLLFAGASVAVVAYSADTLIDGIKGEFDLPTIYYTPEIIFSDKVPLFDINFFNPSEDKEDKIIVNLSNPESTGTADAWNGVAPDNALSDFLKTCSRSDFSTVDSYETNNEYTLPQEVKNLLKRDTGTDYISPLGSAKCLFIPKEDITSMMGQTINTDFSESRSKTQHLAKNSSRYIYMYFWYSETEKCMYQLEVVDQGGEFFDFESKEKFTLYQYAPNEVDENNNVTAITKTYKSSSKLLQNTVASMYKTLRTVAIVALLSILVYVGIRIILSSASKDKAKYKQMLIDWLVAFILLFGLHYVMVFIVDISETLTNVCNNSNIENVPIRIPNGTKLKNEKGQYSERLDGGDDSADIWSTNFMGAVRFYAGLVEKRGFTVKSVSYMLIYMVLVIYTVMFTFQYMRRVLYMAFLTMIAPLVAITYPLDKINDGKAQGFNMWLREYIFNALLQPIHYIIYVIIMGSVLDLVVDAPAYALVALGFMVPAEKFIRKMFGFEKASTVGGFGAAAGAAALMGGLQKLRHNSHKKKNDDNGARGEKGNESRKIRTISAMPDVPNNKTGEKSNSLLNPDDSGSTISLPGQSAVVRTSNLTKLGDSGVTTSGDYTPDTSRITEPDSLGYAPDTALGNDTPYPTRQGDFGFMGTMPTSESGARLDLNIRDTASSDNLGFTGALPYRDNRMSPTHNRSSKQGNDSPRTLYNRPRAREIIRSGMESGKEGVKAIGGHYKRRLDNKLRNLHPLRALRKGLTYGMGAVTLGTIGLAAGIASGDPSKALQYTTAGAVAGGQLGKNLGDTASNIVGIDGAAKAFSYGALGSKYDEIQRAKYKRDFKNNVSNYEAGVKNVSAKGWKEMSKEGGIIDTSLDYGINNIDDMSNIYKTQQKFMNENGLNEAEAQDLAFKAYKLDQQFGDYSSNSKTQENLDKLLQAKGWTDDEQREQIKQGMLNTMRTYQGVQVDEEIEEPEFNYTRMANKNSDTTENSQDEQTKTENVSKRETSKTSGPLKLNPQLFAEPREDKIKTTNNNTNNDDLSDREDDKEDSRDRYQAPIITPMGTAREDAEVAAQRANAESDANKERRRKEREQEDNKEQLEKYKKQIEEERKEAKKKEKKKKTNENRARREAQADKRKKMLEKNNIKDGEQGELVKDSLADKKTKAESSAGSRENRIRTKDANISNVSKTDSTGIDTNVDPIRPLK